MKQFMLTTAIVLTTGFSVHAQDAANDTTETAGEVASEAETMVPGFRVSDFTGKTLYALDPEVIGSLQEERMGDADTRTARWTHTDDVIAERDQWQNIGQIDDVILTADGTVQGVLLDVGGFLGIGAHKVLVDMDDLYLILKDGDSSDNGDSSDSSDEIDDLSVIASLSRDQLEALPEWDEDNLRMGYPLEDPARVTSDDLQTTDAAADGAEPATAGDSTAATTPTADDLTGADVQDGSGESVGKVEDLILDGDAVSGAVIDVGGFLGIGAHRVVLPVESLTVVRDEDGDSVRHVETSLSKDELEALPEYAD